MKLFWFIHICFLCIFTKVTSFNSATSVKSKTWKINRFCFINLKANLINIDLYCVPYWFQFQRQISAFVVKLKRKVACWKMKLFLLIFIIYNSINKLCKTLYGFYNKIYYMKLLRNFYSFIFLRNLYIVYI